MRFRTLGSLVAVLGLVATWTQTGSAQQQDTAVLQQLQSQGQRIAQLEALLTQREQPFQVQPASWNYGPMETRLDAIEAAIATGGGKPGDEWVDTHDQKWQTKIGGQVMLDYYNFYNQNAGALDRFGDMQDYFEARRIWLEFSGKGYGVYDYKLQLDFEPEHIQNSAGDVGIRDLYIGIKDIPLLGYVRMGNFWEPIGMEQNTLSTYITFMERSFVNTYFARDRRVGIAAYNGTACGELRWAYGAFFQDIDPEAKERVDDNQGLDLAGRIWASPMYANQGRHMVHVGLSAGYSRNRLNTVPNFSARPEFHEGVQPVDDAPPVLGRDTFRLGLEGAAVYGPLSAQAEWFYLGNSGPAAVETSYYGAYLYGSFFLTGENRVYDRFDGSFKRVKPLENFWIVDTPEGTCIGAGAVELAARWSWADMVDSASVGGVPRADHGILNAFTLGVNWYWNPHARMMFNYIHGWGDYPLPAATLPVLPSTGTALNTEYDILAASIRFDF